MKMRIQTPDYLSRPQGINHYYGELHYDQGFWKIQGEAVVCQVAKKLFPGSDGCRRGEARFHCNKRNTAELNWIMLRYPLKIMNPDHWEKEYQKTLAHTLQREQINRYPEKRKPNPMHFNEDLHDYQQEGVGFLLQNRRALLADDMGAGKTAQALAALSELKGYPALVIVPSTLTTNWVEECNKFLSVDPKTGSNLSFLSDRIPPATCVLKGRTPYELPESDIYIIHYGLLAAWKEALMELKPEVIIFDEIQELRHIGTQKYSAASLLAESCETVIGLSGTPVYNMGIEMYNVMNIIEYHCLGDRASFSREWCTGYENKEILDPKMFHEHLKREGLFLRRRKSEILKDLPAKRRFVETIGMDKALYANLMTETIAKAQAIQYIEDHREKERAIKQIVDETRKHTGIAKARHVCHFVKTLLDAGEEVLLFAYHHDVWDIYRDELADYSPVFITGRENKKQKDQAVKAVQDGKAKLCCISLRAAVGLNLQKIRNVVFGELDYSPAIHSQAEDRVHRIGQHREVFCYYPVADGGSDERMQEILGLKVSQITGVLGDTPESEADRELAYQAAKKHLHLVVEKLLEKAS